MRSANLVQQHTPKDLVHPELIVYAIASGRQIAHLRLWHQCVEIQEPLPPVAGQEIECEVVAGMSSFGLPLRLTVCLLSSTLAVERQPDRGGRCLEQWLDMLLDMISWEGSAAHRIDQLSIGHIMEANIDEGVCVLLQAEAVDNLANGWPGARRQLFVKIDAPVDAPVTTLMCHETMREGQHMLIPIKEWRVTLQDGNRAIVCSIVMLPQPFCGVSVCICVCVFVRPCI